MRLFLLLLLSLGFAPMLHAQAWPTTTWHVVEEGFFLSEVEPPRDEIARLHENDLSWASAWFERLGFRAPDMERNASGAYQGRLKSDAESIASSVVSNPSADRLMMLSSKPEVAAPVTSIDKLMARGAGHELFHAVAYSYPQYEAFARANTTPLPECGLQGTGRNESGWFREGAASAVQVRLIERQERRPYAYHLEDRSRAAWMRYFDQPLHLPAFKPTMFIPSFRDAEVEQGRSWLCGYASWYFWYAAGEMLGDNLDEKVQYLRYILASNGSVADGGLGYIDQGLRDAAQALSSSTRYDEGLYEIYPRFIAEYANDSAYYEKPTPINLGGEREIQWSSGTIEPLAAQAWQVHVDFPDYLGDDVSIPLRVTVALPEKRDHFHLIEGNSVVRAPQELEDPHEFTVPIRRDTTLLVRLANVAPEASETEAQMFSVLFDFGGFYGVENPGGPRTGSATLEDLAGTDIPPGFAVLSGPPELIGCSGSVGAGSVFDLITAAEASGDVRRTFDDIEADVDDMLEAIEEDEFPMPMGNDLSPAQRRALMERMARENPEMMAQARAALENAQSQVEDFRQTDEAEIVAEIDVEFRDRSRLLMNLVGTASGETCQVFFGAVLRGEEGGAQQLTGIGSRSDPEGPAAIGIDNVIYLAGAAPDLFQVGGETPFEVCMMTPEQQAYEQTVDCPVVCSQGQLVLNEASQGHAKGMLRVDMIRRRPGSGGCPVIDQHDLTLHFNITSANQGQDADVMRGVSDEMFRAMGMDQDTIDAMRKGTNGGGIFR